MDGWRGGQGAQQRQYKHFRTSIWDCMDGVFLAPRVCVYSKIAWQWTIFFHKRRVIWHSNFVIIVIMRLFTDEGILELSQCAVSNAYTQFRRCHIKLFNFQFLGAWFKWYWPLKGILPASFVHRHSVQTRVFFTVTHIVNCGNIFI